MFPPPSWSHAAYPGEWAREDLGVKLIEASDLQGNGAPGKVSLCPAKEGGRRLGYDLALSLGAVARCLGRAGGGQLTWNIQLRREAEGNSVEYT